MAQSGIEGGAAFLPLMGRLWRNWLKPHWPSLVGITVVVAILSAAAGLYPVIIKRAFDAFEARDHAAITWIPLVVILVTSIKGAAMYGLAMLTNRVVTRIEADMQSALYDRLIHADMAQLARDSSAALTQRFTTDFGYIREALTRLSAVFLRDAGTAVAVIAAMFWIDWQMTLVALIAIPIILPPMQGIAKKLRRNARAMQEETGSMASHVAESLGAARIAKTYRLEDYLSARAQISFETMRQLKMKGADQRARLDPLLESAGGLAVAAVLFFISWRIISGQATVGDFTGFITALLLAAQSLRAIGNLNSILQEAAAALHRFFGTLDTKPKIIDASDAVTLDKVQGRIIFRDVSFSYDNHEPALHSIAVTIEPGQRIALVGPSGSGKSTLLSLVPRLFDVSDGAIEIDGHDIRRVTLASLRDAMAAVSQDPLLFDETVRVNIGLGRPGATDADIEQAAKAAAAHDFIMQLPEGYETRVGERGSRLSGGQRQRIAIARAILRDAPILILDEATSALDSESERAVQDALDRLAKGRTSLVIAHRLSTIREADLILVMEDGRIVERGTHDALIERDGLYRRLHRLQTA